jgi:hypothetical protein
MNARATLRAMGRIAVVPLQRRRNQGGMGSLWFTIGFVFFVPVLILLGGAWFRSAQALLFAADAFLVFGCVLLAGAWALFVSSLYEQMEFTSAPLLPGHARHLRLTLVAGVVACCALVATGFGLLFGFVVAPALATLAILTGIVVVMRWGWLGTALAVGLSVLMARGAPVRGAWVAHGTQALIQHGWIASVTTIAVCAAVLWWFAPAGRQPIPRNALPNLRDGAVEGGDRPEREAIGPAKERDAPRAVLLHAWWRDGRLPPETGSPLARALSVLPLNLHWPLAWMWQWRRWLLLVAAANLMDFERLHGHADLIFVVVAGMALTSMADEPLTAAVTLHETRREQELVALLPGVSTGSASSRWLALQMTASHAMSLLLGAIMLQVIGLSMAHSGAELSWIEGSQTLLVLPLACVPFAIPLWSQRATMKPPSGAAGLVLVTLPLPLAAGAALACHLGWLRVGDVAILLVAPTALWCFHRWRRMGAEPGPFPVGRLAG